MRQADEISCLARECFSVCVYVCVWVGKSIMSFGTKVLLCV